MKQRVSDFIADFLVNNGITDCFTVTGGGAMYLNDSFGHNPKMSCTYNHNEQASAMAAEAYARIDNKIALVCVTTGPGATNAITGVAGGWMDSIPMLVISGQARYATTVYASGLKLRTRGVQEFDIIGSVENMTKYCELVTEPNRIRYCLEKALYLAKHGRPGPCWLDIPLDVQGAIIDTEELEGYESTAMNYEVNSQIIEKIIQKLMNAKRPVIFAGNGIRLAGAHNDFLRFVNKAHIPIVTGMSSVDAIASDHPLYAGRNGSTGDRAGNFAIQNCDVLLSIGSRQSFFQTGFNYKTWARKAYKIINDIDSEELEKDSLNANLKVCGDAKDLILKLDAALSNIPLPDYCEWVEQCRMWRKKYPVVQKKHFEDKQANIYAFYDIMTRVLPKNTNIVISVGTSRVAGSQASVIKEGQRVITNSSMAAMGYDLPPAIGVCVASGKKKTILVTGEGSLQMNIQEIQTIIHNRLPIAIFVMNNQGYHSIRMTQQNYFKKPLVGVGPESGDLSFPNLSKLSEAYGLKYLRVNTNEQISDAVQWALDIDVPCICEVMLSTTQITEPKQSSKKLPNGQMLSAPLEDMAPFLSREELRENMYIPLVEE